MAFGEGKNRNRTNPHASLKVRVLQKFQGVPRMVRSFGKATQLRKPVGFFSFQCDKAKRSPFIACLVPRKDGAGSCVTVFGARASYESQVG